MVTTMLTNTVTEREFKDGIFLLALLLIPIPQNNIQYNQLKNIIESYAEKNP